MAQNEKLGVTLSEGDATFGVWAPFADSVAVTGDFNNWSTEGTAMIKNDQGNWFAAISGVAIGQEYKYIIKRGKQRYERNDPRALQLTAAQDASVITDPYFDWQGDNFELPPKNRQVIYELHLGTFNRPDPATPGTFASAAEKLDYLRDLGINVVELMPVNGTNMERWWGYEPTYLYSVEAAYGGRKAFQEFVLAAHQRGIGVIIDVVYNHLTPEPGFDLWRFDGWSKPGKGGIYFYSDHRIETGWGPRPDYGREEVRGYITDSARMWLTDCHVDGLRCDAVFAIRNSKGWNDDPEHDLADGWRLLNEINQVAHSVKPAAMTIAEDVAVNEYITRPERLGGAGFNAQWETTFPASLRDALNPADDHERQLQPLADAISKVFNGDPFQRVVYSESHDADANGHERMNEEIAQGDAANIFARRKSMLAAAITLTAPGIPMLFMGQEFSQSGWFNHWDSLDWQLAEKYSGLVGFYKDLIGLRRSLAGLAEGGLEILRLDNDRKLLAYARGKNQKVVVVLNFANELKTNYELDFPSEGTWKLALNSDWQGYSPDFSNAPSSDIAVTHGKASLTIAPYSILIYSLN